MIGNVFLLKINVAPISHRLNMDIIWRPGQIKTNCFPLQPCASLTAYMWGIAAIHCIRMAKHLQCHWFIHRFFFHRIIFNHPNTFGRKVILNVWDSIPAEKHEISGIMGKLNGAFRYSNVHSNYTFRWPFKTEHSAFKAVVTLVTLPHICDSCYDVQDSMVLCKKTRVHMHEAPIASLSAR